MWKPLRFTCAHAVIWKTRLRRFSHLITKNNNYFGQFTFSSTDSYGNNRRTGWTKVTLHANHDIESAGVA